MSDLPKELLNAIGDLGSNFKLMESRCHEVGNTMFIDLVYCKSPEGQPVEVYEMPVKDTEKEVNDEEEAAAAVSETTGLTLEEVSKAVRDYDIINIQGLYSLPSTHSPEAIKAAVEAAMRNGHNGNKEAYTMQVLRVLGAASYDVTGGTGSEIVCRVNPVQRVKSTAVPVVIRVNDEPFLVLMQSTLAGCYCPVWYNPYLPWFIFAAKHNIEMDRESDEWCDLYDEVFEWHDRLTDLAGTYLNYSEVIRILNTMSSFSGKDVEVHGNVCRDDMVSIAQNMRVDNLGVVS